MSRIRLFVPLSALAINAGRLYYALACMRRHAFKPSARSDPSLIVRNGV